MNLETKDLVTFDYLDDEDRAEFARYLGTDLEDMLVAGSRTPNRLQKYLPEQQYFRIRVILTSLVRDFNLPAVRYTYAIAAFLYSSGVAGSDLSPKLIEIVDSELVLLMKHLHTTDDEDEMSEKDRFERDLKTVGSRWEEYLRDRSSFVL